MAKKNTSDDIAALLLKNRAPKKKSSKKERPEISLDQLKQCNKCLKDVKDSSTHCEYCGSSTNLSDLVYGAYEAFKDAEANYRTVESTLVEQVRKHYEEFAGEGNFSKTFDVEGTDTPGVQVSFKDNFCDIDVEKEDLLHKKLGQKFDQYFQQVREMELKDTSDATVHFLMEKLGQEKFLELFAIKMHISCKPDFDRRQWELSQEIRLVVRQHKPAVKIRADRT